MVDTVKLADANKAFADALSRNSSLKPSTQTFLGGAEGTEGSNFGDVLKGSLESAVAKGKISEQKSVGALFKKVDLPEMVTAIQEAEVALQSVASVRNKVIQAYQEIIKMPI